MATNQPETTGPGLTLEEISVLCGGQVTDADSRVIVTNAAIDSDSVGANGMFCAVPGTRVHGAQFAEASGAAAVLTDKEGAEILRGKDIPLIVVDDVRLWLGPVSAAIYGHPSKDMKVIGITGTSGKTTTSYLVERALLKNHKVGIIGTTGTRINGEAIPTKLTTPEAPTMQALLATMRDCGVTHVVMEVSSHALELGRVRGIFFDVVGFTNLSQDHLDFHGTMENYFRAKSKLFLEQQGGNGSLPAAVICVDDEWGARLAQLVSDEAGQPTTLSTLGTAPASWNVTAVDVTEAGRQNIEATSPHSLLSYSIGLVGSFNVANSLLAIAACGEVGLAANDAAEAISDVQVPGRMQAVEEGQPFLAVVDYAHKPGAVAAVVHTLADYLPSKEGRIGIVMGAGGNRDHDKRPMMGREAAAVADAIFITDDNPRDEDPAEIRKAVETGVNDAVKKRSGRTSHGEAILVHNVGDRATAIDEAVKWARTGDAIVIAGKGHETGQEIHGEIHPFNDVDVLEAALQRRVAQHN